MPKDRVSTRAGIRTCWTSWPISCNNEAGPRPLGGWARCLGLALALWGSAGCKGANTREPDLYEGCSTDENRTLFDDYLTTDRVKNDPAQGPAFVGNTPMEGATIPKNQPPVISWQPSPTDPGRPFGTATCSQCTSCGSLLPLTLPHLPPVSGHVFDLYIKADGVEVYRMMTTLQSFTPKADLFASFSGKQISLELVAATLLRNELQKGPFKAPTRTFKVSP